MNFISLVIYLLISVLSGVGLIGMALDIAAIDIKQYIDYLQMILAENFGIRVLTAVIGVLIILNILRVFQSILSNSYRKKTIRIMTTNGQISISLNAIEDIIKRALDEKEIIAGIKASVLASHREIIVRVRLSLNTEVNINYFAQEIQAKVKEKLEFILGKEKMLKVNIEIRKIASTQKQTKDLDLEDNELLRKY